MGQPAAKQNDQLVSDGTSQVWVQPPGGPPPPPVVTPFNYNGLLDGALSENVFVNGKAVATVDSTATNLIPPSLQPNVTSVGIVLSTVDNTGTVTTGSGRVFINGKTAARNGDKAKTWDYSTPPSPGTPKEIENATIIATSNVFVGDK